MNVKQVFRRSCAWPALAAWLSLAVVVSAQQPRDIGVVRAREGHSTSAIAVPPFDRTGAQVAGDTIFSQVILNDLVLSGFFRPPDNEAFAHETYLLDQKTGTINRAEWHRIGVDYLVKGSYEIQGDEITATVKTYDTISQPGYIFGKRYEKYAPAEARKLAHRISNDIIERLTGVAGVADSKILFVRSYDVRGKDKRICVIDADGHGLRELTRGGELVATPCWGARATEIYYTTYREFNPDLEGLILDSGRRWWLSRFSGFNISPAWSEKQQRIALTMTKDGNSEIYLIDRDPARHQPERLTMDRAIDSSPCWSPDGTQIAFTSDRSGGPQIYIMDIGSKSVRRLTYDGDYNDGAAWSPKGDLIAYSSRVDGDFQICLIKTDGSEGRQITSGPTNNEDPTWAPNGLTIGFGSDRTGVKQVFSMFADGSNVHQLTSGQPSYSPAWSPSMP